jgi:hypothetical protein
MKTKNLKLHRLLSILSLGVALSASAQSMQYSPAATPPDPASVDPGPGLVGLSSTELSVGYQRQEGAPRDLRDFQFISTGPAYTEGIAGITGNFRYDYLAGSANGYSDHRNEAQLGGTGFLMEPWGKPFLTADAGMAWQVAGGASRKGFAYTLDAGVEFQVTRDLDLSPFVEYQAEPHLYDHSPLADFPDHLMDFGVKATYRLAGMWRASLSADIDQHSARDVGLRAGLAYRF